MVPHLRVPRNRTGSQSSTPSVFGPLAILELEAMAIMVGRTEDSGSWCPSASRWLLLLTLKHKFWFLLLILLAPLYTGRRCGNIVPAVMLCPHFSQVDWDVTITQCVFHGHKYKSLRQESASWDSDLLLKVKFHWHAAHGSFTCLWIVWTVVAKLSSCARDHPLAL